MSFFSKIFRASGPDLVTMPNIPIVSAGIEYQLSTGPMTFTPEDLADAVVAANEDPGVRSPRLKLGHIDPRFNGQEFDATPAFGTVKNMSLGDNGMTIYGDYTGVPRWLAEVMPTAYPSRSIEGSKDFHTATGRNWKMVIDAVSLLGVKWPGCTVIEDLPDYYGSDIPKDVVLASKFAAAINVDDVRRTFYSQYATSAQGRSRWWVRAIYLDGGDAHLIAEDDISSELFKVDVRVDGDNVEFGEALPVKMNYQEVPAKQAASLYMEGLLTASGDKIAAAYNTPGESRSVQATQGGEVDAKELRRNLGLPEDASDETVKLVLEQARVSRGAAPLTEVGTGESAQTGGAVLQTMTAPGNDPEKQNTMGDETTPSIEGHQPHKVGEDENSPPEDAVEASKGDLVRIDRSTYEQLMAGAQAGIRLEARLIDQENDEILAAAMREGKFPPARREHYLALLKADREGTQTMLASLASGIIPLEERGINPSAEDLGEQEAYPSAWFPEIAAKAQNGDGTRVFGGVSQNA